MPILLQIISSFILALIISLYGTRIVVRVVSQLKLFDKPNQRSSTEHLTPTLGGIAIYFSFIFTSTLGMIGNELPEITFLRTAMLLIFFIGLKDDLVTLPPRKKIMGQLIAAFILIFFARIRFTNLHGLFGIHEIGMIPGILITVFTIIVIINAFNLMDGIDGLAAGLTMMAALIFGGWFFISGHFDYAILSITLVGAVAGFFFYNVYGKKYKVFMGDTGSLVLGTIISILVIKFNEYNIDQSQPYAVSSSPAISFAIIAYPLIDTIRVMAIRILHHKSPFSADKNHFHHRLLALGFSHKRATMTIVGINILFIAFIFYMHRIGILSLAVYTLFTAAILFLIPESIIKRKKLIKEGDPFQYFLIPDLPVQRNKKRIHILRKKQEVQFPLNKENLFSKWFNIW